MFRSSGSSAQPQISCDPASGSVLPWVERTVTAILASRSATFLHVGDEDAVRFIGDVVLRSWDGDGSVH
jgi:hypothetical protein